jgi:hypothetical protein
MFPCVQDDVLVREIRDGLNMVIDALKVSKLPAENVKVISDVFEVAVNNLSDGIQKNAKERAEVQFENQALLALHALTKDTFEMVKRE